MFRHHRLHEKCAFRCIDAGCEQPQCHVTRTRAEIRCLVDYRNGVVVDDAEERFVFVLQLSPVLDRSQVISDVQGAGWLNAAEDAGHCAKLKSERDELQGKQSIDDAVLLDVALDAANSAAAIIRDAASRREHLTWESKGRSDFVSEVDKSAERSIVD